MMRRIVLACLAACAVAAVAAVGVASGAAGEADWSMNATMIEACSCPMFCQCYFNMQPAGHAGHGAGAEHFCRANIAYKVNRGHFGAVKLDGAKFWIASDLGSDFSDGVFDWAVVTFDRAMTQEQRDAVGTILGHVYPVKWDSFSTAEGAMEWKHMGDVAHATLDGGKTAEIKLRRYAGNTAEPIVVKNLKYFGTKRNDGFVMMPNEVEAYRVGPKAFEFRGTTGFMITIDINSKDVAPPKTAKAY